MFLEMRMFLFTKVLRKRVNLQMRKCMNRGGRKVRMGEESRPPDTLPRRPFSFCLKVGIKGEAVVGSLLGVGARHDTGLLVVRDTLLKEVGLAGK